MFSAAEPRQGSASFASEPCGPLLTRDEHAENSRRPADWACARIYTLLQYERIILSKGVDNASQNAHRHL